MAGTVVAPTPSLYCTGVKLGAPQRMGGNFGASGAIAVLRCCEIRGAFAASGESAWNSGDKVVPAIRRKVSCVRSPLTLEPEDGGDARVAVSGSLRSLADDEMLASRLGLLPLVHRKCS